MPDHTHSPFGTDRFGQAAERFARFFGTPRFILGQTVLVAVWIVLNAIAISLRWDPYPFILLNLAFSTQAAYAAPLILLAQTRQADRDKVAADNLARVAVAQREHVEQQSGGLRELLQINTALTERLAALTAEIHAATCGRPTPLGDHDPSAPPHPPAADA
ncbi:MAG: hypothetical protein QOF04_3102 [Solirubrobacteraceae bacterium]|nr:hypothetical protein [Solirubrobacteraceae bacterium]